nr:PREDICTED: heavy metal-associated isoprenylated plant protein 3-like isoform X1 [Musa acuminata subsp. malaccensis]
MIRVINSYKPTISCPLLLAPTYHGGQLYDRSQDHHLHSSNAHSRAPLLPFPSLLSLIPFFGTPLLLMAEAKECSETLKYQTLILKVSIHCEGCKKKVKKVLQSMEGVYKTTVDPQQHKVVVTGNVAAEILIKKLLKAGKHAELWPETKPMETGGGGGSNAGSNNKKSKNNKPMEPSKNIDNSQVSNGKDDSTQVSDKPESEASKNGSKEPPPPPEKEDEGNKSAATEGGGKKKGKKGQKENSNSNNDNKSGSASGGGGGSATEVEVAPQEASKKAGASGGVAIPPTFNFPVYTTSQLPSYLVSYNSMQPSMSHGGAYYTALPMLQSSYIYSTASPCSCYTCSDENSGACSIM